MDADRSPPVKVGDILDVPIVSTGGRGDGVAKVEGFVVFVPGTREGDNVRIEVKKVFPKVAMAEVVSGDVAGTSVGDVPSDSETFGE